MTETKSWTLEQKFYGDYTDIGSSEVSTQISTTLEKVLPSIIMT